MAWVSAVGALLLVGVLADVFLTLWHPRGQGPLTSGTMTAIWRASRALHRDAGPPPLVGPLAILAVMAAWLLLATLGWALVYLPHIDTGFSFSPGLDPGGRSDLLDSLYVSLVTLATLGYGDVVPTTPWLRVVVPLQALLGFALLTASVTWILQIHPVLGRRRALACRLASLDVPALEQDIRTADSSATASLLDDLAGQVAQIRADLGHYPETYYFRDSDPTMALPASITIALRLVDDGLDAPRKDVRGAARRLGRALDDLAGVAAVHVSPPGPPEQTLRSWAQDHGLRQR